MCAAVCAGAGLLRERRGRPSAGTVLTGVAACCRRGLPGSGPARDPVDASVCAVLAGGMWPRALSALSGLLARSSGETLTLQLLKVRSGKAPGVLHFRPCRSHSMNTKHAACLHEFGRGDPQEKTLDKVFHKSTS